MSRDRLVEARKLIEAKRYEEGAAILRTLPNDPTAQKWLKFLEERGVIAPPPRPLAPNLAVKTNDEYAPTVLSQRIVMVELEIGKKERQLEEIEKALKQAKDGGRNSFIGLVVGLILAAGIIGIPLIFIGAYGIYKNMSEEDKCKQRHEEVSHELEALHEQLAELKIRLHYSRESLQPNYPTV